MAAPGRILVADDEKTFLYTTVDLLQREGYSCDGVESAARALQLLQREPYDLVIADLHTPGSVDLNFVSLLVELTPELPVLVLADHAVLSRTLLELTAPVVAYLPKPCSFADLLEQVRSGVVQSSAYKLVNSVCEQVQEWRQDWQQLKSKARQKVQECAPTLCSGDEYLGLSLRHVIQCLAVMESSLQALKQSGLASSLSPEMQVTSTVEAVPTASEMAPETQRAERLPIIGTRVQKPDPLQTFSLAVQEEYDLSAREWEILSRLLRYQRVPTIAKGLFLSPHTVRNHLKSIFRKMGVHSQSELLDRLLRYVAKAAAVFTLFAQVSV